MTESDVTKDLRLVIVDDHEFAREAVAAMLDAEPGITIVGQAGNVYQARAVITDVEPDVAVLDLNMPDGSGREIVEHFATALPELRCIIFTSSVQQAEVEELREAGAEAVVLKSLLSTDLVDAIRRVKTQDPGANGSE